MKGLWIHVLVFVMTASGVTGAGKPPLDLESYPKNNRIWLGSYSAEVAINPEIELESVRYGELLWMFENEAEVKKGDVLAYCGRAKIKHSKAQLELAQAQLKIDLKTAHWDHMNETANLESEVQAIESDISRYKLSDAERQLAGPQLVARVEEHRAKLKQRLAVAMERLEPELRSEQLRIEIEKLNQDMERAQIEHVELLNSLAIHAPHDGIVHRLTEGKVRALDVVGRLERRGRAVVLLKLLDAEILRVDPELLEITTTGPKGNRMTGGFTGFTRILGKLDGPKMYNFELSPEGDVELDNSMSGERMVSIYRKIDREAYIVPKSKFLFSNTEEVQRMGWRAFLKSIWPDAEIVYIGPNTIAVAKGS